MGREVFPIRGVSTRLGSLEPTKHGLTALELCREIVTMVQTADAGQGLNPAACCRTSLDWTPHRGAFCQPQMRPVLVVKPMIFSRIDRRSLDSQGSERIEKIELQGMRRVNNDGA